MRLSISKDFIDHCLNVAKVPDDDIKRIIKLSGRDVSKFSSILVKEGWFTSSDLGKYLGDSIDCSFVDMAKTQFQPEALAKVPKEVAQKLCAVPLYTLGEGITIAMANPYDKGAIAELKKYCGSLLVSPVFSLPEDIQAAIKIHYPD